MPRSTLDPSREIEGAVPLGRRLQIAAPLAVGLLLIVAAVVLMLDIFQSPPVPEESVPEQPASEPEVVHTGPVPVPMQEIPHGDPVTLEPDRRSDTTGISRWKLDRFPAGWDAELAAEIAEFCDRIDYDFSKPEEYVEAGKALEELKAFLAGLGPEAVPTLGAILDAEVNRLSRRKFIEALGDLGPYSEEATGHLYDYFREHVSDPQSRSELNYVIKAMARLQNETSYDVIQSFIEDDTVDGSYRAGFVRALGDHPRREESLPLFADMMIQGEHANVRNNAAQALGKIGTPNAIPDLQQAYENESYWIVKQTILGSIGKTGSPSAVPFLADVARLAEERGVRLSAAKALQRIGTREAYAVLAELSQTEPDAQNRAYILKWSQEPY